MGSPPASTPARRRKKVRVDSQTAAFAEVTRRLPRHERADVSPLSIAHDCELCGRPLPPQKTGRPASYHADCRKLAELLNWAEKRFEHTGPFTHAAGRKVRSRLWSLANRLNNRTLPPEGAPPE